jgi:hypothetical protein
MQSKKGTLVETIADVGSGFIISYIISLAILIPLNIGSIAGESAGVTIALISLVYTIAAIARKYIIRRVYERYFR